MPATKLTYHLSSVLSYFNTTLESSFRQVVSRFYIPISCHRYIKLTFTPFRKSFTRAAKVMLRLILSNPTFFEVQLFNHHKSSIEFVSIHRPTHFAQHTFNAFRRILPVLAAKNVPFFKKYGNTSFFLQRKPSTVFVS